MGEGQISFAAFGDWPLAKANGQYSKTKSWSLGNLWWLGYLERDFLRICETK